VLACATGDDQWSRDYWDKGFRLFAMGIDSMLLQGALKQGMAVLEALKSPGKKKPARSS
jgi:2-keto-3-deoxy-L-rhamnonate aldolase RhmA